MAVISPAGTREGPRAPDRPRRREGGRARRARRWIPYAFLLPALVFELLVHFVPIVLGVGMSAFRVTQYQISHWWDAPFAGLGNFRIAVDLDSPTGRSLAQSFLVTLGFTAVVLTAAWLLGLAAALALHRSFRGRAVLRALFLVPYALPAYAGVITWRFIFQLTTEQTRTLAVGLQSYSTEADVYWNQIMAASLVVSVPVVAGFLLLQRFLVAGFTAGAVK